MRRFWESLKNHFIPHKGNAFRPHILRRRWLLFFLAVIFAGEGFFVASLIARQSGFNFLAAVVQSELITLTNSARQDSRLSTLKEDARLNAAAKAKAQDMAKVGYFSHVGPDGKQPWSWIAESGYNYQYAGENLAVRFVDSKDVVNAWMASPTHRANIVKPAYREIGIGVADGLYQGQPATFVVQYFGKSEASAPVQGKVLGAETSPAQEGATSLENSLVRSVARLAAEPRSTAELLLGGIAALMVLALALTFFFHIQVQPLEMLLGGAFVAVFAVSLIVFNSQLLSSTMTVGDQSASAVDTVRGGVVIGDSGASAQR